ncbi:MAG: hypothetical protein Q4F63_07305 [Clostridia bacterium]|nr:hypothetical protein [Clostridia bacterium]
MIFIKSIDEPDFGCEGVPDDKVITDKAVFVNEDGEEEVLNVPEKYVWELKIDEGMYISDEIYDKIKKRSV